MARAKLNLPSRQIGALKRLIRNVAVPESALCRPLPQESETAALGVPSQSPSAIPQPPPGGWPEDAGWREDAEQRQGLMGEDPQV